MPDGYYRLAKPISDMAVEDTGDRNEEPVQTSICRFDGNAFESRIALASDAKKPALSSIRQISKRHPGGVNARRLPGLQRR
jgi:hypothetical protein